jgi:Surface antigen variable number repeat
MNSTCHSLSLLCGLCFAATSCVPTIKDTKSKGRVIVSLEIRHHGPKGIFTPEFRKMIRKMIESQPGTIYSEAVVEDDLRRLYDSGYADDVRFATDLTDGEVHLIEDIHTMPMMGQRQ